MSTTPDNHDSDFTSQVDALIRAGRSEEALRLIRRMLSRADPPNSREQIARLHKDLGKAYLSRGGGNRQRNMESAADAFRIALRFNARTKSKDLWSACQNGLGAAYASMPRGDRSRNLELARRHFELSLQGGTRKSDPVAWATAQINIANVLVDRVRGDRLENLKDAIKAASLASKVFTRVRYPNQWAFAQNNQGRAYLTLPSGDRAENIELAIQAFERALEVRTPENNKIEWAMTHNNLGNAYSERIDGEAADNFTKALEHYQHALTVYVRAEQPAAWAMTMHNLGVTYTERNHTGDLESALAAFNEALTVRTRRSMPLNWAMTQNTIGDIYLALRSGDRGDNIEKAIRAYRRSLTVFTRKTSPTEWALANRDLGLAYARRLRGRTAKNLEQARGYLTVAADWYRRTNHHIRLREAAEELGKVLARLRQWRSAASAFSTAVASADNVYRTSLLAETRQAHLHESSDLIHTAAYSLARLGQLKAAVVTIERGRMRELGEALQRDRAELKGLATDHGNLVDAYRIAVGRIQAVEAKQRDLAAGLKQRGKGAQPQQLRRRVAQAYAALESAVTRIRSVHGFEHFLEPFDWSSVTEAAAIKPVAYILTTDDGSLALVVARDHGSARVIPVWLPSLRQADLLSLLRSTEADGFVHLQQRGNAYGISRQLETILPALGLRLLKPLQRRLSALKVDSITLIPCGELGRLPLHAARLNDHTILADTITISYTPSLRMQISAAARTARVNGRESGVVGLAIAKGVEGLPLAEVELNAAMACFDHKWSSSWRREDPRFKGHFQQQLRHGTHVHLACHGLYEPGNPLKSRLTLTGRRVRPTEPYRRWELLQLAEVLDGRLFEGKRLVVAAACQSGLAPAGEAADEAIGFPAGLMAAGAQGVVGSLWSVDDVATALLVSRFYELHRRHGADPAVALRGAQIWLRELSNSALRAYVEGHEHLRAFRTEILAGKRDPRNADERAYADPYYWAGFVYNGV